MQGLRMWSAQRLGGILAFLAFSSSCHEPRILGKATREERTFSTP